MRWLLILAFAFLIPMPVAAAPAEISHERISATVTADWNKDGARDRAVLVETEDAVDLLIYLSTGPSQSMELHTRASDIAWRGGFSGQQPTLTLSSAESLKLTAQNWAIGRYQFESMLTIAFKDGVFLAAGYTYMVNDRLEKNAGKCEVNLLTGHGVRDGKAFRAAQRALPVTKWAETKIPPNWEDPKIPTECINLFD